MAQVFRVDLTQWSAVPDLDSSHLLFPLFYSTKLMILIQNFINGAFQAPADAKYLPSINPATASEYAQLPSSTKTDVDQAVEAAIDAFPSWSATTAQRKSDVLNSIATLINDRLEEFAVAESIDQGKPIALARVI